MKGNSFSYELFMINIIVKAKIKNIFYKLGGIRSKEPFFHRGFKRPFFSSEFWEVFFHHLLSTPFSIVVMGDLFSIVVLAMINFSFLFFSFLFFSFLDFCFIYYLRGQLVGVEMYPASRFEGL